MRDSIHRGRTLVMLCVLVVLVASGVSAQLLDFTQPDETTEGEPALVPAVDERLQLAVADSQYPVTPGDIYQITFLQGVETITSQVLVESDYSINLGVIGDVNGRGKRFAELKPEIEELFANAYPRSLPSVTIASIGLFQVTLTGAIPETIRVNAWGLSRLSDVIDGAVGPYTSLRTVSVTSRIGSRRTYDVFRAVDQGDADQDPFLRPGDSVSFVRRQRVVGVQGEVYEPGPYELLVGEGLDELRQYSQDFTPTADTNRLVVQRQSGDQVRQIPVGTVAQASGFDFQNGDVLIVPARVIPRPIVFIEGAIQIAFDVQPEVDEQSTIPVYNRITRELTVGDTLYSLLLDIQDQISPFGDIERGYVIRQDVPDPIRINMRDVLYRQSAYNDFELLPFDRVVIPLDQPYVIVSGDVTLPSRYPYNPSVGYQYYLNLAGLGAESFIDVRDRVSVYDRDGLLVDTDSTIQPGFTIHVGQERFVVVSGDVPDPGAYEHESGNGYAYYLSLAGTGAESFLNVADRVRVYDDLGNLVDLDADIHPGYTINLLPLDDRFVVVSGDVPNPGAYSYVQSRDPTYYLRLAGVGAEGLAILRNTVEIYDVGGLVQPPGTTILPDFTVFVPPSVEPILPEEQFALVTGAVLAPGLQPIAGERGAAYYIQQAGGVNTEVSDDGAYVVRDVFGEAKPSDSTIGAGDTIEVLRNGFVYNFNRYFPIITSGLTFITTIITLVTTLNQ